MVTLADGSTIPTLGVVQVPVSIQGYKETLTCLVIDLSDDYDLILGDAWLYDHAGIIDYRQHHIRLVSGVGRLLRLPPSSSGTLPPGHGHTPRAILCVPFLMPFGLIAGAPLFSCFGSPGRRPP